MYVILQQRSLLENSSASELPCTITGAHTAQQVALVRNNKSILEK